jgi:ribonuclease P protein component
MLRLQHATDFERVRRDGRSHAHPLIVLVTCRRPPQAENVLPQTRCGFTAGKTVGGAVKRNRAKRLMREAVRTRYPDMALGWDLLLIARAPLANASFTETQTAIDQLLRRAQLLAR